MPVVLIIEKGGSIKELKIASYNEDELYKKAGFKSKEGFKKHTTWNIEVEDKKYSIALYAKDNGNAGRENKYDLPPPLDNTLFFGNMVLTNKDGTEDLRKEQWKKVYEQLFGGFEDIEESDEDDESEDLDGVELTKDGYVKDDFIVESDEEEEEIEESEESEEEIKPKRKQRKVKQVTKKEPKNTKKTKQEENVENEYETTTKELEPEEYLTR
jgi:hypothetical protein